MLVLLGLILIFFDKGWSSNQGLQKLRKDPCRMFRISTMLDTMLCLGAKMVDPAGLMVFRSHEFLHEFPRWWNEIPKWMSREGLKSRGDLKHLSRIMGQCLYRGHDSMIPWTPWYWYCNYRLILFIMGDDWILFSSIYSPGTSGLHGETIPLWWASLPVEPWTCTKMLNDSTVRYASYSLIQSSQSAFEDSIWLF